MRYYQGFHNQYALSEHGEKLAESARFGDFKPNWVGTEQWCDLLGPDVNNLDHMPHTLRIADKFITKQGVENPHPVLLTAITHDWAESIVGDIAHPSKTAETEAEEMEAYKWVSWDVLRDRSPNHLSTVLPVLTGEHEYHARVFKAIEYIGYCSTGMRSRLVADGLNEGLIDANTESRTEKIQLVGGLYALHAAVAESSLPKLITMAEEFPALRSAKWLSS